MFELTDEELDDLRTKFSTANISSKSRYNPHVFTEQGLYMLMTVLKGTVLIECGKMLQKGTPMLDDNGNVKKDEKGKIIYEPYKIKVLKGFIITGVWGFGSTPLFAL